MISWSHNPSTCSIWAFPDMRSRRLSLHGGYLAVDGENTHLPSFDTSTSIVSDDSGPELRAKKVDALVARLRLVVVPYQSLSIARIHELCANPGNAAPVCRRSVMVGALGRTTVGVNNSRHGIGG
ncbi:hypothetical protein CYLTODRAFT_417011 [Cylindrobasidium torrendii FP15055 ss-10]|uniref:Uncharacterized protein n=1 Tax=Cylindrobasidium torrendii FP15055 ss-10 TaxID=1314674 RepID=A0A0D7BT25_9AGAR|nr:hypothetical protein CYLTODRAFT_417011 [Cylindrobasidium torrendii FP15055 ss-10]